MKTDVPIWFGLNGHAHTKQLSGPCEITAHQGCALPSRCVRLQILPSCPWDNSRSSCTATTVGPVQRTSHLSTWDLQCQSLVYWTATNKSSLGLLGHGLQEVGLWHLLTGQNYHKYPEHSSESSSPGWPKAVIMEYISTAYVCLGNRRVD